MATQSRVESDAPIIGFHANKGKFKSYADVATSAFEYISSNAPGFTPCVAMFVSGPKNVHLNVDHDTATRIGSRNGGEIVFHASYMDIPWTDTQGRAQLKSKSLDSHDVFERIDAMVAICAISRADLVIHSGKRIFDTDYNDIVLARMSESISKVVEDAPRVPRIFIETMSHDDRYASTTNLNAIFDNDGALWHDDNGISGIGLCIDTAHIWAAGADISTRSQCATWFGSLRDDIPIAIHLNDSTEVIGTHHDIHTTLGDGEIWALNDGYISILDWARERHAPVILERNNDPLNEVARDLATISRKLNW